MMKDKLMQRNRLSHTRAYEIEVLRTLIRRHISDREAIKGINQERLSFIYFIDAHELKAYIHGVSKEFIEGFELGPESTISSSEDRPNMLAELRLKCEQALRWLIFEQPNPVIILPPHGIEIDEEIAFQRHRELVRDLGLLNDARNQLRALRSGGFADELISKLAQSALRGNEQSKAELVQYLGRAAPALAVILKFLPQAVDSVQSRIKELVQKSNLTTLRMVDWSRYGLNNQEADAIRGVGIDEKIVSRWCNRLESSRSNSERANRLDAEAIAYIEELNATLTESSIPVRGVLVTHTGTLTHAARQADVSMGEKLDVGFPIRHIRFLVWDYSSVGRRTEAEPDTEDPLGRAVESFELAVEIYAEQMQARSDASPVLQSSETNALMEALNAFESARSTMHLARKDELHSFDNSGGRSAAEIQTLLQWLKSEQDLESLIADRLSSLVVTFGCEVLTNEGIKDLQMIVRCAPTSSAGIIQMLPFAHQTIGPVELPGVLSPRLQRFTISADPATAPDGVPRQYLNLALLHAANESLQLAEMYAKAAADNADLLKQYTLGAEARFLSAQIFRMTSARAQGRSRAPDESRSRLDAALRFLSEAARMKPSPRFELERAATLLERILHNLDSDETTKRLFAEGVSIVETVYLKVADSVTSCVRTAELALAYVLVDRKVSRDYGTEGVATRNFAEHWHLRLRKSLDDLRSDEDYALEEMPWLTRALEVIGYSIIHDERVRAGERAAVDGDSGIPNNLSLEIHSVQSGLDACDDRLSQLVSQVLADVNSRSGSSWSYSFIHAPVWDRRDVLRATSIIEDTSIQDAIRSANEILHRVGEDQRIRLGDPDQMKYLKQAKLAYSQITEILPQGIDPAIKFLVNMEYCYSCFLECTATFDLVDKEKMLQRLVERYNLLKNEFGPRATLLYRQSIVLGELGMHAEALESNREALDVASDTDPMMGGATWMRSTLRRRIGLHFSREAKDQLAKLKLGPHSEEMYERHRSTVREAFRNTFEGFEINQRDVSLRDRAEHLRRLNNIVYYGCLYVQADGQFEALDETFTREKFRQYLVELKSRAPAVETEWSYAHTIGAAHSVLGDSKDALAAADSLLSLLARSGASTQSVAIRDAIEEAFRWKRLAHEGSKFSA